MDLTHRFLTASWKALDDHILRGGPFPDDEVLVKIDPTLAVLMQGSDDDEMPVHTPQEEE
jgi:hypothetical protein